ncbi:MAG: metal-dependent hydrolase [Verrucomicrobia bacterium]|jgi:L-ascorbate metabolism protein UlaG (beta-lactamase superfamily)|nr:MAG: metal-dependent hydrolase [Verrucomicrobiota bacterium]
MKITYFGHSCFQVEVAGKKLLFDPFIRPNPLAAKIDITTLKPDYICISHGHFDHVADVEVIAHASGAVLVGCFEVMEWFSRKGLKKTESMNIGGSQNFEFGSITLTNALHSSSMPDGSYGGQPGGFLVKTTEGNFYYSGDTGLTHDMKLIAAAAPFRFLVLCIGDRFTMGIEDAITATKWLGTKEVLGVHYNTFPQIQIDTEAAKKAFHEEGFNLHLLSVGSSWDAVPRTSPNQKIKNTKE